MYYRADCLRKLHKMWHGLGIILLWGVILSACTSVEHTSERARTVDNAVRLLQELDQHAAWQTIGAGIDKLNEQGEGYIAQIRLKTETISADRDLNNIPNQSVTLVLRMDARRNAQVEWTTDGERHIYFLEGIRNSAGQYRVYRVADGRYSCLGENGENLFLRNGLRSIFDHYAINAAGARALTVVHQSDERTLVGRETIHYQLKSRLPEALRLLEQFDYPELSASLEPSKMFALSGHLDLDQKTGALLYLASIYIEVGQQRQATFTFEVTQWGGVSDFTLPTADMIAQPCLPD